MQAISKVMTMQERIIRTVPQQLRLLQAVIKPITTPLTGQTTTQNSNILVSMWLKADVI